MISIIVILSSNPKIAEKSIQSIFNNKIKEQFELIALIPNENVELILSKFKQKRIKIIPIKYLNRGKSFSLNSAFKILKGRIWIITGGDSYLKEDSINNLLKKFSDKPVGCVIGRPVSLNKKENLLGFWSHLLLDAGAHLIRKELNDHEKFIEGTDYLFAFRNNITRNIPPNVAGDSIIPYLVMKKGYHVKYQEDAIVYVENPKNIKKFINQKVGAAKSHEYLGSYAPFFPRVKSFKNEIKKGTFNALRYPSTSKEFFWTILLLFVRLYIWAKVKWDLKILKREYFVN